MSQKRARQALSNPDQSVAALKVFVGELYDTEPPAQLELMLIEDYDHYIELIGDMLRPDHINRAGA